MKLAVMTSFEILREPQVRRWNALGAELHERDTLLFLLTTNLHDGLQVPYLEIPYALHGFKDVFDLSTAVHEVDNLVGVEQYWIRDFEEDRARQGVGACRAFYKTILRILQPDFVAAWNTLFPQSRILQLLCEEQDVPVFTIERGFLPDTLLLERLRNNCGSELNNSFAAAQFAKNYVAKPELVAAYREHYRTTRPAKYLPGDQQALMDQRERIAQNEKPLIVALGQSHGGGIYPRTNKVARWNFPGFDDYQSALEALRDAAPNAQLAFRDHPVNTWENEQTPLPEGVFRMDAGPLYEALDFADYVVTLGSTTSLYEVLLRKLPLMVIGDTAVGRFKPYLECRDGKIPSSLTDAMDSAFEECAPRAESALSYLLENMLIAETPDVPVPNQLADLAEFIASYDLDCDIPLQERLETLVAFANAA